MDFCLVFTPDEPDIYTLNPSGWLLLRLCDGRTEAEIAESYCAAVEPLLSPEQSRRQVREGIGDLMQKGIVELVHAQRRRRTRSGAIHGRRS